MSPPRRAPPAIALARLQRVCASTLLLLLSFASVGHAATLGQCDAPGQCEPGNQLASLDDDRHGANAPPLGLDFLRILKPECGRCLKSCLGGKIQHAQMTAMKIQAPLSLVTWYLFKNRPFAMMPLEKALGKLLGVHPAIFAGLGSAAYMSCRELCDIDCPYPGSSVDPQHIPELDAVDATDTRFLARLYQPRGGGGGKRGGGGFADALGEIFRV